MLQVGQVVVAAEGEGPQGGEVTVLADQFCRVFTETGMDEVLLIGRLCNIVPGSRTLTSATYLVREDPMVMVSVGHVRRRCEFCPYNAGKILVLRLRNPFQ